MSFYVEPVLIYVQIKFRFANWKMFLVLASNLMFFFKTQQKDFNLDKYEDYLIISIATKKIFNSLHKKKTAKAKDCSATMAKKKLIYFSNRVFNRKLICRY